MKHIFMLLGLWGMLSMAGNAQDIAISSGSLLQKKAKQIFTPVVLQKGHVMQRKGGIQPAPGDLKVEHTIYDSLVHLNWFSPGSDHWLFYHNQKVSSLIGIGSEFVFDAAIKFSAEQMAQFPQMKIKSVGFFASDAETQYAVAVWSGEGGNTTLHEQEVSQVNVDGWNTVDLDSMLSIMPDVDYYFGVKCITEAYPLTTDNGPVCKVGYSDIIRFEDEEFTSLYENSGIDANWNIQVYLEAGDQVESPDYFNVYRNNEIIDSSLTNVHTDVLEVSGEYNYSVSAVYDDFETDKSNTVNILFDNERVYRNAVVVEATLDVNYERAQGVEQAMIDLLENGQKIVPVSYHFSYNTDGVSEPFYNDFAIERVSYYLDFGNIYALPFAIFDGDYPVMGGGTSSLYDAYLEAYNKQIAVKTPLGMQTTIEMISGSTYDIDINLEKLGYVATMDSAVMHVYIIQNAVEHEWFNHSMVNFLPIDILTETNGTSLVFTDDTFSTTIPLVFSPLQDNTNKWVVAFVQDKSSGKVLNADYLRVPLNKRIVFKAVNSNGLAVPQASIQVLDNELTTDMDGFTSMIMSDGLDSVLFIAQKEECVDVNGIFHPYSTDTVVVEFADWNTLANKNTPNLQLFPNPTSEILRIKGISVDYWQIVSADGKKLQEGTGAGFENVINVHELPEGCYLLEIHAADKKILERIIKTK